MRFVVATVLLISSVITLGLGLILQGPFEAGATASISYKVKGADSYVLIPHETLSQHDGKVYVEASGIKNIFYADAREKDIQYWIGKSNFVRLGTNPSDGTGFTSAIRMGGTNANPVNSDLWRNQISVPSKLKTQVSMFEDTGVLLAGNGFSPAPNKISVIWEIDQPVNWPWLLFGVGFTLLIAALIANYLGFRNVRKLRGPRRRIPRAPSGPKYRKRIRAEVPRRGRRVSGRGRAKVVALPIFLSVALLAGCSTSPAVSTDQVQVKYPQLQVYLNDNQIQRIVADLATEVKAADQKRDANTLRKRVAGPTLTVRSVHYHLQNKSKKIAALSDIIANPITVALPTQIPSEENEWQPRTLMVVTKSADEKMAPQFMVLQQRSPRENYKLWYLIGLLPGNKLPAVASQDVGALTVSSDNAFLASNLKSLPYKYGDVINRRAESKYANEFMLSADAFYEARNADQTKQSATLKKVKASIKFQHSLGDSNILGMLTYKSGGLIALAMTDTSVIKPSRSGSAVSVTEPEQKILLNAPGSATGLKINYSNMLLFYVPIAGSNEKIRLLGASQGILTVKALK